MGARKRLPGDHALACAVQGLDIPTKDLLFDDIEDEAIAPEAETEKLVTGMIQYSAISPGRNFRGSSFPSFLPRLLFRHLSACL